MPPPMTRNRSDFLVDSRGDGPYLPRRLTRYVQRSRNREDRVWYGPRYQDPQPLCRHRGFRSSRRSHSRAFPSAADGYPRNISRLGLRPLSVQSSITWSAQSDEKPLCVAQREGAEDLEEAGKSLIQGRAESCNPEGRGIEGFSDSMAGTVLDHVLPTNLIPSCVSRHRCQPSVTAAEALQDVSTSLRSAKHITIGSLCTYLNSASLGLACFFSGTEPGTTCMMDCWQANGFRQRYRQM